MSFLTGSAPQANFSTQPTVSPEQTGLIQLLSNLFNTGQGTIQPAQGTFAAPVTGPQQQVLTQLQGQAGTPSTSGLPEAQSAVTGALTALPGVQNFQAPQIDPTQAFTQGVVQPLTTNFNQNILPGISGAQGGSAGGAFGTEGLQAKQNAVTNLNQTLAQTGAQYALGAAQSNQQADLTANAQRLAAISTTPGVAGASATLPGTTASANVSPLIQILTALGLPQQTQQTQISGSYNVGQQSLADLMTAAFSPTQTTTGIGSGGASGALPSLLQAAGPIIAALLA
jgi:hypothetical protein